MTDAPFPVVKSPSGIWMRPGNGADEYIINETSTYQPFFDLITDDDVVLDIGSNIGSVAVAILNAGAKRVVSVEADPDNAFLTRLNLSRFPVDDWKVIEKAVVGNHGPAVAEFYRPAGNPGMGSLWMHDSPPTHGRFSETIKVPTIPFATVDMGHQPTMLKVDIEAGEYSFIDQILDLPKRIRVFAIEWHNFSPHISDGFCMQGYQQATQSLTEAQGFKIIWSTPHKMTPGQHSSEMIIYSR